MKINKAIENLYRGIIVICSLVILKNNSINLAIKDSKNADIIEGSINATIAFSIVVFNIIIIDRNQNIILINTEYSLGNKKLQETIRVDVSTT